jgi:hypothetical protein
VMHCAQRIQARSGWQAKRQQWVMACSIVLTRLRALGPPQTCKAGKYKQYSMEGREM